jgi:hypothetical protein
MKLAITTPKAALSTIFVAALLVATPGCGGGNGGPEKTSIGVLVEQAGMVSFQEGTVRAVTSAPSKVMVGNGLAGALGGARVKMLSAGTHELILSMPQLADSQVPVCYSITTTPREAAIEYRLHQREDSNVVMRVRLTGSRDQEIRIEWSSIILIGPKTLAPNLDRPEAYLRPTSCVQSGGDAVAKLADTLWSDNGQTAVYAGNIQELVRDMKQRNPLRSMDALGMLESGANWICTANANLAAALLRCKHIPARSIAVIPPISQRLEMHRVVEYFDSGQWLKFDPSSLQKDIPMKSWQNIVMARTTASDEDLAMKPRIGASLGCPYGQELEFLDGGITFWGQDMFWTLGKPMADFEASDEAVELARRQWSEFLAGGKLSQSQIKAAAARNAPDFLEALKSR